MMSIMRETTTVQKAIYRNQLRDEDDCLDYMMKQPNIMPRLNDRILKADNAAFVDLTGDALPSLQLESFATLNKDMMAGTLAKHLKYLTAGSSGSGGSNKKDKLHVLTAWTIVDLERPQGRELFRGALTQFKASNQLRIGMHV